MKHEWTLMAAGVVLGLSLCASASDGHTSECVGDASSAKPEAAIGGLKLITQKVQAQKTAPVEEDCASVKQLSPVGTRCKTSKGVVFTRMKNGWKDSGDGGSLWHDEDRNPSMYFENSQPNSESYCKNRGLKQQVNMYLPSKQDFEVADSHGIRELMKDMKGHSYWTTTVDPGNPSGGYYFSGSSGGFGTYRRAQGDFYNYTCICISQ
ncbi:MAG: hypothetical protein A2Z97_09805 [Bdellovibrionales bacterium GWB1_52_6]|nr:MAG: hypothetical protein A2Z97_09805 [Bdellovibrionales bacterium GWB1_52_6]OFZ04847.1 MAG: hypothetical protein A2X97_08695 [Bdellovibrionales bacterium GWA1_52_35]HCM38933.1 hypothetical protein [Bdellovibrionales bacterium]